MGERDALAGDLRRYFSEYVRTLASVGLKADVPTSGAKMSSHLDAMMHSIDDLMLLSSVALVATEREEHPASNAPQQRNPNSKWDEFSRAQ